MNCIVDVSIPTPLIEPCENTYLSTSCISIPEANTTLDLPIGSTQTEVNTAITLALIDKEQQIVTLHGLISALEARIIPLEYT